jgi:hypothetical protein
MSAEGPNDKQQDKRQAVPFSIADILTKITPLTLASTEFKLEDLKKITLPTFAPIEFKLDTSKIDAILAEFRSPVAADLSCFMPKFDLSYFKLKEEEQQERETFIREHEEAIRTPFDILRKLDPHIHDIISSARTDLFNPSKMGEEIHQIFEEAARNSGHQ